MTARPDLAALRVAAEAATKAEDAVIAASGQHREDLWTANHDAERAFHDEANPQAILDLLSELEALRAREAQPPLWHAVMSEDAPVINKAIRRADVADEYAQKCRNDGYTVEVVPLYAAPPAPASQPDVIEAAMKPAPADLPGMARYAAMQAALEALEAIEAKAHEYGGPFAHWTTDTAREAIAALRAALKETK